MHGKDQCVQGLPGEFVCAVGPKGGDQFGAGRTTPVADGTDGEVQEQGFGFAAIPENGEVSSLEDAKRSQQANLNWRASLNRLPIRGIVPGPRPQLPAEPDALFSRGFLHGSHPARDTTVSLARQRRGRGYSQSAVLRRSERTGG